ALDTTTYTCSLRGILKKEKGTRKNLIVVGDFVLFDPKESVIDHVEERHSILSRQEHLHRKTEQLLAANVDQILIIVSVQQPRIKPSLIDRYIIASLKGNMEPVLVINKADLSGEVKSIVQTYRNIGIPVIVLSAKSGEGIEELEKQMKGRLSCFAGQSGVGKSSLINAVTGLDLRVGEISAHNEKGVHTTTTARLIPLCCGGWCIDTPGIRSFGVWDLTREDLIQYFPEIAQIGKRCKYADCSHTHEPDCAVVAALEKEEIPPLRYESYCNLLDEITE
ncbi:MAG: ribosome small subunit-dependent GTPase A, partial [Chlamydiales bacterium]